MDPNRLMVLSHWTRFLVVTKIATPTLYCYPVYSSSSKVNLLRFTPVFLRRLLNAGLDPLLDKQEDTGYREIPTRHGAGWHSVLRGESNMCIV